MKNFWKIKNRIAIWSRVYIQKYSEQDFKEIIALLCSSQHYSQLPRGGSNLIYINKLTKIMWYTYTIEYHTALKMKEILLHVMTWMNLEDFILSKISHSQKNILLFHSHSKTFSINFRFAYFQFLFYLVNWDSWDSNQNWLVRPSGRIDQKIHFVWHHG